jgi:hypothetical protein
MKALRGPKIQPTWTVTIHMAGDIAVAKSLLRTEAWNNGLCVTISPQTFIYTAGEEEGFRVGFENYPRFPSRPKDITARAIQITEALIHVCRQRTGLVVTPKETIWITANAPGAR